MPLKTVVIDCGLPSYFNVASFLAVITYPENESAAQKFRDQLILACLQDIARHEQRRIVIAIPLEIFQPNVEMKSGALRAGIKRLHKRFGIGFQMILRQAGLMEINGYTSGGTMELLRELIDEKDLSTAKTKIWKPTWPVFHAAASFAHAAILQYYGIPNLNALKFSDFPLLGFRKLIFKMMMENEMENHLVLFAEEVRKRVLRRNIYEKIGDHNTIHFVLVNESAAKHGFASADAGIGRLEGKSHIRLGQKRD